MKYNRSEIFKRAWSIVKTDGLNMSQSLIIAWAEAKSIKTSVLNHLKDNLNLRMKNKEIDQYHVNTKDWTTRTDHRTYISFVTQQAQRRKKQECGYVDNLTNTYIPAPNYNILEL